MVIRKIFASIIILTVLTASALSDGSKDKKDKSDNPLLKQKSITAVKIDNPPVVDGNIDSNEMLAIYPEGHTIQLQQLCTLFTYS